MINIWFEKKSLEINSILNIYIFVHCLVYNIVFNIVENVFVLAVVFFMSYFIEMFKIHFYDFFVGKKCLVKQQDIKQ